MLIFDATGKTRLHEENTHSVELNSQNTETAYDAFNLQIRIFSIAT